ncbi:hypothetical protein [Streptomyces sp. DvalAA-83]|nr:hypothetical protein K373_04889 [Streptomyces sp. DvalAA-21]RAJ40953.1 hypothetical protein K351_00403 [Streptomyces sp. DpondAA-E10]RAJ43971.1 hypothetical protein K352_05043 [Streptomyces sp. DpondAA-A50]SCD60327.1 hypothetical protein GA0115235_10483 [Streptomyces sp. DpondAA-F4a]SCM08867.1 hypothetical protein SAMN04883147_107531 [Streptomyces sp. DpondAA-F4]
MDGLQAQWLLGPGTVDMAASTELVVTSVLNALNALTPDPAATGPVADD